jgi:opacity protein-like surface antigen
VLLTVTHLIHACGTLFSTIQLHFSDTVDIMKKIIAPLLLTLLPLAPVAQAIEYQDELEPPNVDFFIELQGTRTDFNNLGGDDAGGLRVRLGLDLLDTKVAGWMLRTEIGLNQFGETRQSSSVTVPDLSDSTKETIIDRTQQLSLSGIELGLRLYDNRYFSVRGGAFIYSLKNSVEETKTLVNSGVPDAPIALPPQAETISGIAPYIGAGLEIPLVESVKAVAEFNLYQVDSESLNNISVGFRFSF